MKHNKVYVNSKLLINNRRRFRLIDLTEQQIQALLNKSSVIEKTKQKQNPTKQKQKPYLCFKVIYFYIFQYSLLLNWARTHLHKYIIGCPF